MRYQTFIYCFLCFVTEIIAIQLYFININNDKQLKLLSDQFKKFLEPTIDELRSDYEFKSVKNICDRHFGSIYGTKAQKLLCLENYKQRKLRNEPYKRRRKQTKQPKQFFDMTRGVVSKFSSDYIDFKANRNMDDFSNDYLDVGDLVRNDYEARRAWPYETKLHKTKGTLRADDSDTSSEEESDDSQNRYQIVDNQSSESDSGSTESDSGSREAKKVAKKEAKLIYFQGRNRYVKDYDGRKRLQHFMPKRYHWDEGDIKKTRLLLV
ncbi:hypothetical protein O3G_MSEX014092 [Manduca sexta]|uniref:Uncharacterized protein n=1 Tax=Manduca sexta TaxID=7130 RepID=A0A921ZTX5_MANSE|nr:hypothetical protein O3G_MSEX014092 [Manduca sexta]